MRLYACIISSDTYYAQWIRLELSGLGRTVAISDSVSSAPSAELYIIDTDNVSFDSVCRGKAIYFGHSENTNPEFSPYLIRPFSATELIFTCDDLLKRGHNFSVQKPQAEQSLQKGRVLYGGDEYILTDKEFQLFTLLNSANGESVSRERLCEKLWGYQDDNSLNLYIHYLRQKLEKNGIKAIVSHRKRGYSIIMRGGEE